MPPPLHFNQIFLNANVHFTSLFFDANGNPTNPSSANVNINYPTKGGGTKNVQVPMSIVSGMLWTADWISSSSPPVNAAPGIVYWSVETAGPQITVRDGQFYLTANAANLALDT